MSLKDHTINTNLLTRKINRNQTMRHDILFLNDDNFLQKISSIKNEIENEKVFETNVRYDKKKFKKISNNEFYRFQLQIN